MRNLNTSIPIAKNVEVMEVGKGNFQVLKYMAFGFGMFLIVRVA